MTATSGTGGKVKDNATGGVAAATKSATVLDKKEAKKLRSYESRKIRKPLMEKRRRARINNCLDELKRILLTANNNGAVATGTRKEKPAKLEKADILEGILTLIQSSPVMKTAGGAVETANANAVGHPTGKKASTTTPGLMASGATAATTTTCYTPDNNEMMMMTEAAVVNSSSTAPGSMPCHVKVSSSSASESEDDDESPPSSPDQSQHSKTRSPSRRFQQQPLSNCCEHDDNNKMDNMGNVIIPTDVSTFSPAPPPPPETTFINGFTECLRLVHKQLPTNLEEKLESYLNELQHQLHNNVNPFAKSYYGTNQNMAVVTAAGKCVEYSPQHSPASSSEDFHMTLDMEEGSVAGMKSNKYHHHQNNVAYPVVEPPTSTSPVLISSSSNSPKLSYYNHPHQQMNENGRMKRTIIPGGRTSQNKYFISTRLPNGEVAFVLQSESKTANDNCGFDQAYDNYHEYGFSSQQQQQQQQQNTGQYNNQQFAEHQHYYEQRSHSRQYFHSRENKIKSESYSPSHSKFVDIDSPRAPWRPW